MNRQQFWKWCKSQLARIRSNLTRDFNYASDSFFGLDFMLAAAGARWTSGNVKLQRCWNFYHWVIYVPAALIFWNSFLNVWRLEPMDIILSSLQGSLSLVVTILLMRIILRYYDPLMETRQYVNRRDFGRNLEQSLRIRGEAFYHIRKVVVGGLGFMMVCGASIPFVDFSNNHLYKLPFNIREEHPSVQFFCEKAVNVWVIGLALMIALVFLVLYMVLVGLTAESKVIAQLFSQISANTDKRVQRELNLNPGNSSQQEAIEKRFFWKYLQEEINSCIALHIEFLEMKNKIRPFLNASFLITYYSTAVTLASGAIYLTQMTQINIFTLLTLSYSLWVTIECALLTRMVNRATEVTESISWEVYSLDWPMKLRYESRFRKEYRSVRKELATVMAVSRMPLRLNCFGFFEFTLDQFWILLNMTYDLYKFFRNFI